MIGLGRVIRVTWLKTDLTLRFAFILLHVTGNSIMTESQSAAQIELKKRSIGPLDKRRNTRRCRSCAKLRVKVRTFLILLEQPACLFMSSAKGGRPVKDAFGWRLPASRNQFSSDRFNLSIPLGTICFLQRFQVCECEDMMTTYTWPISHFSFSDATLVETFLPVLGR